MIQIGQTINIYPTLAMAQAVIDANQPYADDGEVYAILTRDDGRFVVAITINGEHAFTL